MADKVDYEALLLKCKESLEDVIGWKVFLFLPQSFGWRLFVVLTVIFTYIMRTSEFFFGITVRYYSYLEFACDVIYLFDTVCSTLHLVMVKTRKLRHGKKKSIRFLLIDYLSLVPFSMFSGFFIFLEQNTFDELIKTLRVNVCLRTYQIFTFFSETRFWIYKMKVYFIVVCFQMCLYLILLTHIVSCLYFASLKESAKKKCKENLVNCIFEMELLAFSFLSQSYTTASFSTPFAESRLFTIITFLSGYFITYGCLIPLLFFAIFNFLKKYYKSAKRYKQLNLLIKNITQKKILKDKILDYFQSIWTYGKSGRGTEALQIFPLCFQKNIFCDMHWEAFKHSELLEGLSFGCKRTLSLRMTKDFILPNTTILNKGEKNLNFMYLESGMFQIMAEENNTSPVLTLSGGTVLGESSFFLQTESKAILKTAKLSVINYLSYGDMLRVMLDYPNDMKQLFKRFKYRLNVAKTTYERKTEICPYFSDEIHQYTVTKSNTKSNIKWIKQQFRTVLEIHKANERGKKVDEKYLHDVTAQMDHVSLYLSMIAVNDEIINKYDAVCLRMRFPWILDPQSSCIVLWEKIVLLFTFITAFLYPAYIGWFPHLPTWFFNYTVLTSFVYLIDVVLQLFTAVRIKNVTISKFETIFAYRLASLSFYVDVIAALPLQLIKYLTGDNEKPFILGLYLVNALFKCYRLLTFLLKWNYNDNSQTLWRTVIKDMFILNLSIYWLGAVFKLTGVECLFYDCGGPNDDWYAKFTKRRQNDEDRYFVPIYIVLFLGLDMPYEIFYTKLLPSFVLYFLSFFYFRTFFLICHTECVCSFALDRLGHLNYKKLMELVNNFMRVRKIPGRIPNRVSDTMSFQWHYDRGNYITQEKRIIDDISASLRNELDQHSLSQTLKLCPLFKSEDDDFIKDVCKISHRIALPANSVLLTFGTQTMCLYMLHQGYLQVNSFLNDDIIKNVGKSIVITSGSIFPVFIAFNQIPSVLTARTTTDCELISFKLEDILSVMTVHKVLKDVVEALKTTDVRRLFTARPALSRIEYPIRFEKHIQYPKIKYLEHFLKFIFLNKVVNPHSKSYMQWEIVRIFCTLTGLVFWPFVFGSLAKSNKEYVMYVLLVVDSVTWIDFYVRLQVAYYNSKGIFITHPIATSSHYLTTSFITDLVAFLPCFHILYSFNHKTFDYDLTTFIVHMVLRLLGLYRFIGLIDYVNDVKNLLYWLDFTKYVVISVIMLNIYANIKMYYFVFNKKDPRFNFPQSPVELYFNELALSIEFMARVKFVSEGFDLISLIKIVAFSVLGWIVEVTVCAFLILNFLSSAKISSTYRYYLKSFLRFLNKEKTEDRFISEAKEHYEHEWIQKKGIDFKILFSRFPDILHEDLMLSLYKTTLISVSCLAKANEGFHRAVSKALEEVYLKKGSTIIFENQVTTNIFFIYKGQCGVEGLRVTLCKGSMLGDIKREGVMKHTVTAKTHLCLLKISSTKFFLIMKNFFHTKRAYEEEISTVDDFVESISQETIEEDVDKNLPDADENALLESAFEPVDTGGRADGTQVRSSLFEEESKKETKGILRPNSRSVRILNILFIVDAFLTIFLVPIIIGIRSLSPVSLVVTYVLDIIWLIKIIVCFRTAVLNPKTGNLIYNRKVIWRNYLFQWDGFILDGLTVLPIEVIPFIYTKAWNQPTRCDAVYWFSLRILRFFFINKEINAEKNKLSINSFLRLIKIMIFKLFMIVFFASLNMQISTAKDILISSCYWTFCRDQWDAFLYSCMCVINTYTGSGLQICVPENTSQVILELVISIWGYIAKALLFVQAVVVFYVLQSPKFEQIRQLEELENYLIARDISPALLNRTKRYFIDLIDYCKEGPIPTFLRIAPDFIKINIMGDLYVHHLANCFVFEGINMNFLRQLSARLEKYIYFPGDYITEKGDVDHNLYFIHEGEVFCIQKDETYPALERPVSMFFRGEYFGVIEGIFPCQPHAHTFRAKTLTEVLILNFKKWEDMRLAFPDITQYIYDKALKTQVFPTTAPIKT